MRPTRRPRWLLVSISAVITVVLVVSLLIGHSTEINACPLIDPAPLSCFPERRLAILLGGLTAAILGGAAGIVASRMANTRGAIVTALVGLTLIGGTCMTALPALFASR